MKHQKTSNFIEAKSNRESRGTFLGTVRLLTPYLWPADRADLKLRVVLAILLMIVSKFVTIAIPYAFKWTTNALVSGQATRQSAPAQRPEGRRRADLPLRRVARI